MSIVSLSLVAALSAATAGPPGLARIEHEFQAAIEKRNPDPDRLYHLHLIAARELRLHGFGAKAQDYYKKALAIRTNEDKAEPAIEVFHHSLREFQLSGKPEQVRRDLELALRHTTDPTARSYLESMASGFLDASGPSPMLEQSLYAHPLLKRRLNFLIEQKKFPEALAMLDRESLARASVLEQVTFDALLVVVNGKASGPLLCEASLRAYPDAYALSTKACRVLVGYIETGKKDPALLADLALFYEKESIRDTSILRTLEALP